MPQADLINRIVTGNARAVDKNKRWS